MLHTSTVTVCTVLHTSTVTVFTVHTSNDSCNSVVSNGPNSVLKHDQTVILKLQFPSNSLYTVKILPKFLFPVALRHDSGSWSPPDGASRPHTPEAVGLLWTSDQPGAENSDNTPKRQRSMPQAGIEIAIPASERPHTRSLDGAATGTGINILEYGI